ncbi:MAG: hypothetical protein ABW072_11290 [Sedimenticola sp.]
MAMNRRQGKAQPRIAPEDWYLIERLVRLEWSPEQISLWLKETGRLSISQEWIYQHILQDKLCGDVLYRHLRCQKQRKKRYGSYERRGQIPTRLLLRSVQPL